MVEFHVLRCSECQTFQVLQVTKSQKWKCKLCGSKQSVIKVYGQGTGADCRKHVQKLNTLRGELDLFKEEASILSPRSSTVIPSSHLTAKEKTTSQWSRYLDAPSDDMVESCHKNEKRAEANGIFVTTDRTLYDHERKQAKNNKRPIAFTDDHYPQHFSFDKRYKETHRRSSKSNMSFASSALSSKHDSVPAKHMPDFQSSKNCFQVQRSSLQMLSKQCDNTTFWKNFEMDTVNKIKDASKYETVSYMDMEIGKPPLCKRPPLSQQNKFVKENVISQTEPLKPKNKDVTTFSSSASKWSTFLDDKQRTEATDSDDESELTLNDRGQLTVCLPISISGSSKTWQSS